MLYTSLPPEGVKVLDNLIKAKNNMDIASNSLFYRQGFADGFRVILQSITK